MATSQDIRSEVRALIGDDDVDNETFSDSQLNNIMSAALRRLRNRVGMTITLSSGSFSTDPNDSQSDLIILQTACLISQRQFRDAVGKGVRVQQDENMIDTAAGLSGYAQSVGGEYSFCAILEDAISVYKETGLVDISSATSEYASNIWAGTQKLYEDVDYDGQGSDRLWNDGKGRGRGGRRGSGRNYETGGLDNSDRFEGEF